MDLGAVAHATAVVLTPAAGYDAEAGIRALHCRNGTVMAQDEATAEQFGMHSAAIATGLVHAVHRYVMNSPPRSSRTSPESSSAPGACQRRWRG